MKAKLREKKRAVKMRREGFSLREIADKLGVAKSSVSVWVRGVILSFKQNERLKIRKIEGQKMAVRVNIERRRVRFKKIKKEVEDLVDKQSLSVFDYQVTVALLYWAEGAKTSGGVEFTNSDPVMVKVFLKSLRVGFEIDESKFRANIHIHKYHDDEKQKRWWSEVTGIPLSQFYKSYLKPHTGKRKRRNYPGCIRVTYHSRELLDKIVCLWRVLAVKINKGP